MSSVYLIDVMIMLAAAVIFVPICRAIHLGAVPGFLIAGVAVGPSGLGLISNVTQIGQIAEIGVVLLLFMIGIELKPSRLWLMRRIVFGLGSLQVVVTAIVLGTLCHLLLDMPLPVATLVGPALALSSTAFVLQLLTEQKLLRSDYGRTSFGILLVQDLAVVPLLALTPLLVSRESGIGLDIGVAVTYSVLTIGLVVLVGRYLLNPILYRVALSGNPEVFTASAVLIVLAAGLATEHAGLSMAMGSFLAGLLIADSSYRHQVISEIQPFRGLLLGLFFMSMGMSLNLDLLAENPMTTFGLAAILIAIKIVLTTALTRLFDLRSREGLAVGLVLAQGGEFALVLFALARKVDLLTESTFQQLLLVVLISMLVTPLLAAIASQLIRRQTPGHSDPIEASQMAPVVIAGFGRVGRRIGEMFQRAGKPFIAVDLNPVTVERERGQGYPVFYGDVRRSELLRTAGASNADVFIITINDPEATIELVEALRSQYPGITIYARGHSLRECRKLRALGASGVVSENIQASLALADMALARVGVGETERDSILANFRHTYQRQIEQIEQIEDASRPDGNGQLNGDN